METGALIAILTAGVQLKRIPRTGWLQRGVPDPENVAAHSYGVALAAMMLARLLDSEIDLGRMLQMAVLHDLPEARTGDIPAPVKEYLPDAAEPIKITLERGALHEITTGLPFAEEWRALWEEHVAETSVEARIVHDADKLDMFTQALIYEEQTGNRHLSQFWQREPRFHFAESRQIYLALRRRRQAD